MKKLLPILAACVFAVSPAFAGELANVKVVTDASPDYSDMESMVHSITGNWSTDAEKMWALFYWDHIGRRQTSPMWLHGYEVTDPIRQYNDYGFTMCSTISGIKCSTWNYMGYPCRFWEIGLHTVPDVWYEGGFHHYDNSLSVIYTLCDGKTIAGVDDIGKTLGCELSGGKTEPGHIAIYHSLNGTSINGFLEGADTERTLDHLGQGSFKPKNIHYQYQYYSQDRGHRYILNLRDGEVYTRYYQRQDADSPNAVQVGDKAYNKNYKADPAYFVPNRGQKGEGAGKDPEAPNIRYHIRANGERVYHPPVNQFYSSSNINAVAPLNGTSNTTLNFGDLKYSLSPAKGEPGEVVYKVEGANVMCSMKIHALADVTSDGSASIAISTNNGRQWKDVWKTDKTNVGQIPADVKLIDEVNGTYEALVKVTLTKASLNDISFDTITEVNGKTQPQLKLGKNTVYVGAGEQTESIVFWPDLRKENYKEYAVDESNVKAVKNRLGQADPTKDSHVTFKMDAPTDFTSVTYGGRLYNSGKKSHIEFLHSFDGGKTWKQDYSLTDNKSPWDVIHYETITDIPTGTKSVLLRYALAGSEVPPPPPPGKEGEKPIDPGSCSLYGVRMEANHKIEQPSNEPVEVTFTWSERQADYSLVKRSHTELVQKLPATYTINVGGADHPVVNALAINLKGARQDVKYGYSDDKDVGGEKWTGVWATYGNNLALHKPYTVSAPSGDNWGAGDPEGKKLTDGRVGSSYTGGVNFREGAIWPSGKNPEIVVDLGSVQKCAAFRVHTNGYEWWDSLKGENKDQIEVLISSDGNDYKSVGSFTMNLMRKDIPLNFMLPDDETMCGPNLFLAPKDGPVEARYVKYKVTNHRMTDITEVQVLDGFTFKPFDLKIALPDAGQNGKAPPKADVSPNSKKWTDADLPQNIIGVQPKAPQ